MSLADEMHGRGLGFWDAHGGAMTGAGVVTGGGCGNGREACCSMAEGTGTGCTIFLQLLCNWIKTALIKDLPHIIEWMTNLHFR